MHKIVIISPDQEIIQQLSYLLHNEGHDFFALKGEDLLQEPEDFTETAIALLDVIHLSTLPMEVLRLLHNTASYKHIDVIVLVDREIYLDDVLLSSYLNAGAIDYVVKPIRELILTVRINTALQRHKFLQEITQKNLQFAQQQLQIIKQTDEIHKQKEIAQNAVSNLKSSLNYAQRIQNIFLPETAYINHLLPKHFIFFRPKDIVSGDFYWISMCQNKVTLVVADCTGHGVPGAFMSMIGFEQLHDIINIHLIHRPEEILNKLHIGVKTVLRQDKTANRDGMDVAVAVIDYKNLVLEFSAAKNPLYFVQHLPNSPIIPTEVSIIKGDMLPVGGVQLDEGRDFVKSTILLGENNTIYSTTFISFPMAIKTNLAETKIESLAQKDSESYCSNCIRYQWKSKINS
jgi:DNA-binding response OmpR family regulator